MDQSPERRDEKRSLFAVIAMLLAIASVVVLTVAWLALIGYGALALFDWIFG
jgi:hypothetical protein